MCMLEFCLIQSMGVQESARLEIIRKPDRNLTETETNMLIRVGLQFSYECKVGFGPVLGPGPGKSKEKERPDI